MTKFMVSTRVGEGEKMSLSTVWGITAPQSKAKQFKAGYGYPCATREMPQSAARGWSANQ